MGVMLSLAARGDGTESSLFPLSWAWPERNGVWPDHTTFPASITFTSELPAGGTTPPGTGCHYRNWSGGVAEVQIHRNVPLFKKPFWNVHSVPVALAPVLRLARSNILAA